METFYEELRSIVGAAPNEAIIDAVRRLVAERDGLKKRLAYAEAGFPVWSKKVYEEMLAEQKAHATGQQKRADKLQRQLEEAKRPQAWVSNICGDVRPVLSGFPCPSCINPECIAFKRPTPDVHGVCGVCRYARVFCALIVESEQEHIARGDRIRGKAE